MGEQTGLVISLEPVIEALTGAITTADIVSLFAQVVTIALPFILTWFGLRFLYKTFKRAIAGRER